MNYNYSKNKHCKCGKLITNPSKMCHSCCQKKRFKNPKNHPSYKGALIEIKCDYCQEKIKRYRYILKIRTVNFCSRNCFGLWQSKNRIGKNHPNYICGEGNYPYPLKFAEELKQQIRKRDNHECQNCGMTEEEHLIVYGRVLPIHHIDYNKQNCNSKNLISLCDSCNSRANFNRNYWIELYKDKLKCLQK
jgi:hypothetical protein